MTTTPIAVLDKGFVSLITEPDSDLKVVNAARVSFKKTSQWVTELADPENPYSSRTFLHEDDQRLIRYLARHHHWTPFAHCSALVVFDEDEGDSALELAAQPGVSTFLDPHLTFCRISLAHVTKNDHLSRYFDPSLHGHSISALRGTEYLVNMTINSDWRECPVLAPVTLHMKMPIFVARQFMKHCVGVVYNEVSRRYVDETPEFYVPDQWRGRPKNKKQGSDGVVDLSDAFRAAGPGKDAEFADPSQISAALSTSLYGGLLDHGVAPEMARMVLPVSMYTEFWATMGLRDAARIYALRKDPHAQMEIQAFAIAMNEAILTSQWAEFWPAIRDNTLKEYEVEQDPNRPSQ